MTSQKFLAWCHVRASSLTDIELEMVKSETAAGTLARLERVLAGTEPSENREVIRLMLEIARLPCAGMRGKVVAKLTDCA